MSAGPIPRMGLAARIHDILRDRIVAGEMTAAGAIRQDALAAELGVSKIPLREAFAKLEQEGLVLSRTNHGYFVRPLTAAEAYDVFDLRLKIEPGAVAAAAGLADGAEIAAARACLDASNAATGGGAAAGPLNRAFHMALVRPCTRALTTRTVERLQLIAERYVVHHLSTTGRPDRAVGEHEALFEAWSRGDGERAAGLCARHIESTLADLSRELDRQAGPAANAA